MRRTVGYEHKPERLEGVIAAGDVVAYGVDDEPQKLVVLRCSACGTRLRVLGSAKAPAPRCTRTSFSRTDVTMYPTCFSAYLGDEMRPTASMCPNSTS